jgi:uncharacterized membrane protein
MSDRVIATYDSYRDAEQAVDFLSDQGFPVERATIVGRDVKLVERVTGRMTTAKAALNGAVAGALVGVLIGWLFVVFDWFSPIVASGWLIVDGLWFGAVVGALYGMVAHALTRGRRDFASVGGLQADRYELAVDEEVADQAARLLGGAPSRRGDGRFTRDADAPARTAPSAAPPSNPSS